MVRLSLSPGALDRIGSCSHISKRSICEDGSMCNDITTKLHV